MKLGLIELKKKLILPEEKKQHRFTLSEMMHFASKEKNTLMKLQEKQRCIIHKDL
jgi:hypothetical protein